MSNVLIDREKIDILANAISDKSGVPITMTLDEMVEAVDGIKTGGESNLQAKTYTVNSAGTATVTADSGYDGLSSVNVSAPSAVLVGSLAPTIDTHEITVSNSGEIFSFVSYGGNLFFVNQGGFVSSSDKISIYNSGSQTLQLQTQAATTITPSTSSQTAVAAGKYTTGAVTVAAMPSGTAGTPTASKGSVSNHSISVTPSVINTSGYITGSTKTGTAVTVSASELVSGTYTVDSSGTKNVTNYASASVPSGTAGTPSASKGTVSNHSVSVTPSVTNTTGWITGSTNTGTAVTVTASELASGNKSITENGTDIDVVGYSTVSVDVQGGGSATYRLDNIIPEQTITTSTTYAKAYGGAIQNYTETPQVGEMYLVTYDSTEYVCEGYRGDSTGYVIGEYRLFTSTTVNQYMSVPFACAYYTDDDGFVLVTRNTNAHTIKVDKLTFIDDGETFTTKTITQNGTYNASDDDADGYSSVTVNVPTGTPTIQSLTVNPSTTQQTFNASGVDGYKPVTVAAMPTMTLPTTATSSATSGYTSKATIGRSTAAQYINIPPGYNSAGAYYVISAVANGSATAPSSISGTAASVSTGTNTLTLTKTVSVTPTVSAGYVSSGTAGNSSVSLTASVTTKAAATITPTTTNQTIAAGTYLTGTQTIAGDADLVGSNILSTANIFGVQGTVDFIDVYIRSAAPTSSVGNDGDIYIQE